VHMIRSKWFWGLVALLPVVIAATALFCPAGLLAQGEAAPVAAPSHAAGGEANLVLPDLGQVSFFGGTSGRPEMGTATHLVNLG
jgi:hypothetical protein